MLTITARRARFLGGQHSRHRLQNHTLKSICCSKERYPQGRTKTVELYHAAGGSMHVEGMANICVCANNIQATLQVAVSSKLKETMLISCDDLRKLRVIPADFPNAVLT